MTAPIPPFELHSVVHLVRPTGSRARNLEELRLGIENASERSLFFHTRHPQLRLPVGLESAHDDFSAWVNGVLQDRETAERLSFVVQSQFDSPEHLRRALLETLARIPEATRISRTTQPESELVFLTVESVPLPTGARVGDARELVHALIAADASVWFYHLIEQPWFPGGPSLDEWLVSQEEERLATWLREGAAAARPIESMRRSLLRRWRQSRLGRRVREAATAPEGIRREAGRATVARLVRRITKTGPQP